PVAAPSGLTNGFGPGPEALDVTAHWALGGTEVHQFGQPVGILMRSAERGLVPATFENGQWRVLFRAPSAGTLPTGWDDGFWTDASGFHILTGPGLAGTESELARRLVPVPSLMGKTPVQAAALLAPRGLTVGAVTTGGTGPAGTVTGPAGLVFAEQGSAIDLTVSSGSALTR